MLSPIYEDEDLAAFDKPAGMDCAPLRLGEGGSLLEEAIASRPEIGRVKGRKESEPGLLHRLDRGTSGIVLAAKNDAAFEAMLRAQEGGRFLKEYLALCAEAAPDLPGARPGRGEAEGGTIRSLFRSYGPGARRVAPLAAGEGPLYETRILSRTEAGMLEAGGAAYRLELLRVTLERGFRHQVRAHLAWIGLPLLGDELYAPEALKRAAAPGEASPRLMLHALAVVFPHPRTGESLRLEVSAPTSFGS